jgi:hypothetical protein
MQVLAALLAKIFVGARFFSHDPDTAAVLPDLADVALHKQPSGIIGDVGREERILAEGVLEAVFGVFVKGRGALVFLVAANAANGLVLFLIIAVAVRHVGSIGFVSRFFPLLDLSAGATAGSEWILGCDCVFWRLRG